MLLTVIYLLVAQCHQVGLLWCQMIHFLKVWVWWLVVQLMMLVILECASSMSLSMVSQLSIVLFISPISISVFCLYVTSPHLWFFNVIIYWWFSFTFWTDNESPDISCPSDIAVNVSIGTNESTVVFMVNASDIVDGVVNTTCWIETNVDTVEVNSGDLLRLVTHWWHVYIWCCREHCIV